ncbi:nicotinamide N-methyltransferase-like isoform X4 [Ranitomeya imitator]|uniref:nicotinamide N-methyltransferase-like isoform X4 n=1 Tax=Ranitomeya imitator TaxID=111125 RepID=UPI0037E9890E
MANNYTSQQTYIDHFNPKDYLQTYYEPKEGMLYGEWTDFILRNLHETFTNVFDEIIVSDFLEQNRVEFQKWLKKDPDAFDWTHIIKEDYEKKAEKLRSKVKEVLKCDALKRNPYDPIVVPPVDCLLSCLCLEVPCEDIKSYCEVLKNFKDLIKPGGHLLISSVLNATFYYVGKTCFGSMTTNKEDLEMAFKEAGYQIEKAAYAPRIDKSQMDISNYDAHYFILARKPK